MGNTIVTTKKHVDRFQCALYTNNADTYEDLVLKLFVKSLEGDAKLWFRNLPDGVIKNWNDLMRIFMGAWDIKIDNKFLLNQLHEIRKKGNETVQEINIKFQNVIDKIHDEVNPLDASILLYYVNAFDGQFGFMLRDKAPASLDAAQ